MSSFNIFPGKLGLRMLTLTNDSDDEVYRVHLGLLTSQSLHYEEVYKHLPVDQPCTLHFQDADATTVGLLITYLYRGSIVQLPKSATTTQINFFPRNISKAPLNLLQGGTSIVPYKGLLLPENGQTPSTNTPPVSYDNFTNISFMPSYQDHSPEELRLADYTVGRRLFVGLFGSPQIGNRNHSTSPMQYSTPGSPGVAAPIKFGSSILAVDTKTEKAEEKVSLPSINPEVSAPINLGSSIISAVTTKTEEAQEKINLPPAISPTDIHQLSLIKLCIIAEKASWSTLYNAAIRAYIADEAELLRSMPASHMEIIYTMSKPDSSLRRVARDSIGAMGIGQNVKMYAQLAMKCEDFALDIVGKALTGSFAAPRAVNLAVGSYNMA